MGDEYGRPLASVVIPAHNEEKSILRLLDALAENMSLYQFEIIVVCNGCTDRTAELARGSGSDVQVIDLVEPSKKAALRVGDERAGFFPRVFVDADVEISAGAIQMLVNSIQHGGFLASAPTRVFPRAGVGWLVRTYYDVWERLPQVREGLFGRGVIALSKLGNERVREIPQVMSDDLAMSEIFRPDERQIVAESEVIIRPPKKIGDLIRRRTRVATGNAEADSSGLRGTSAQTSLSSLWGIIVADPKIAFKMPIFFGVTVISRMIAWRVVRSGDFSTWRRDESSRN